MRGPRAIADQPPPATFVDERGQEWEMIPDPQGPLLDRPDLPPGTRTIIVDWLARLLLNAALREWEEDTSAAAEVVDRMSGRSLSADDA
jgi:hypothetical protein